MIDKAGRPVVVGIRRDLGLADNPALGAVQTGRPNLPRGILEETADRCRPVAASSWWLDGSLSALGTVALDARGDEIHLSTGASLP